MSDEPPSGAPSDEAPIDPSKWPGPGGDDFDPKTHIWDGREWWTSDRQFWWDGFQWQSHDVPHPPQAMPVELSPKAKVRRRDFWIGFTGWLLVNVVLVIVVTQLQVSQQGIGGGTLLLANLIAIVAFAFVRGMVALGMLTAFATAFAVVVLAGIFFTAGDFVAAGSGFGGAIVVWLIGVVLIPVGVVFTLRAIHRSIK